MKLITLLFLLFALPSIGFAELKDENLLQGIPKGYKIDFQTQKGNMRMTEMVPQTETVDNWTEMVTTQIFLGMKTPEQFQDTMAKNWAAACKDSITAPVTHGKENGYPFAIWLQDCPLNPATNKPEKTWFKAMQGNDSFYVVQKAFKFEPSDQQIVEWMKYFRAIMICDTRGNKHPCPKLKK